MPTPKYKVRPDTGELQEYLFEYNGILALKNFVARVDGERLILHSAEDMNFSILDALVSEVEINGVVYDNADAAQQALQRLTFNTNRPVIMTQRERELLLGALQSGNYVGTAADLKSLIDGKVDKEAGKGLSTNDFTNAYKQKLDTLEDYDIELDENTTELRFKRGSNVVRRISLMFLDDEGTKLVYNKPEKTLELRDKRNNLLTSIPVSHFVSNIPDGIVVQNGKIKLMAGNNVIFENAFSYNDLADKPDLNFVPKSYFNKESYFSETVITSNSLPFLTKEIFLENIDNSKNNIWSQKNELNVGSRASSGYAKVKSSGYKVAGIDNIERALLSNGETGEGPFLDRQNEHNLDISSIDTFKNLPNGIHRVNVPGEGGCLVVFRTVSSASAICLLAPTYENHRLKYNWTIDQNRYGSKYRELAYFEDVHRVGIERYDWTVTKEYQNSIVFVPRSGFIELNQIEHLGSISFRKVFAGGNVTFTCDGKQIIYTNDAVFNGGDGSTAVVSIYNNKCYIDIRNI